VSGGVDLKAEIASDDEMSKNPSDDLPNQKKIQKMPVYLWQQGALNREGR